MKKRNDISKILKLIRRRCKSTNNKRLELAKHTPGPWSYNPGNRDVITERQGCNDILIAQLYKIGQNTEANARLIAAAPEVLEALKRCLNDDAGNLEPETVHLAMEAIKKAEGRARE